MSAYNVERYGVCDVTRSTCPLLISVDSAGRIYDKATAVRLFLFHYDSDSNM